MLGSPDDTTLIEEEAGSFYKNNACKNGYMRLRAIPSILRIHSSKKKEGHEQHYSELLLFVPWRDEEVEFCRHSPEDCIALYQSKIEDINFVKKELFRGEDLLDLLECDLELLRPSHVYDEINAQGVQEDDDDLDEGLEDDPKFAALDPKDLQEQDRPSLEQFKYKKVHIPDEEEIGAITQRLAGEQMELVMKVANFCKQLVKARNSPHESVTPIRLVIHGGKDKYHT